jgi:hypothetical protein
VNSSTSPVVVSKAPEGTFFHNPDLASFGGDVLLTYDDGNSISLEKLNTISGEVAVSGTTYPLALGGSGAATEARIAGNQGVGGTAPTGNSNPQRVLVAYTQDGDIKAAVFDESSAIQKGPLKISDASTQNHKATVASDFKDFFIVWSGMVGGMEQVFGAKVTAQ